MYVYICIRTCTVSAYVYFQWVAFHQPHFHNLEYDSPTDDVMVRREKTNIFGLQFRTNFSGSKPLFPGVNALASSKLGSGTVESPAGAKALNETWTGIEPGTFLLGGNIANHYATVLPNNQHTKQIKHMHLLSILQNYMY